MSDPYLNCDYCGDQCACRATRDDLERFRAALQEIERLLSGDRSTLVIDRVAEIAKSGFHHK